MDGSWRGSRLPRDVAGLPSLAERAAAALLYVQVTREHLDTEEREVFPVAELSRLEEVVPD